MSSGLGKRQLWNQLHKLAHPETKSKNQTTNLEIMSMVVSVYVHYAWSYIWISGPFLKVIVPKSHGILCILVISSINIINVSPSNRHLKSQYLMHLTQLSLCNLESDQPVWNRRHPEHAPMFRGNHWCTFCNFETHSECIWTNRKTQALALTEIVRRV